MTRHADRIRALGLIALGLTAAGCSSSADQAREPVDVVASEQEVELVAGLREAMVVGTERAVVRLGRTGGYAKDPAVRIPLPDGAQQVSDLLRDAKLGYLIDDLAAAMNRAAEQAAGEAAAILAPAAESMLVVNAPKLLDGRNTAITRYFRQRTANQVAAAYTPVIQRHLDAEPGYQQWIREIPEKRHQYPYLEPLAIDLVPFVTDAALDGLFTAIGDEEIAIRTRPEKRTTPTLQAVFGER